MKLKEKKKNSRYFKKENKVIIILFFSIIPLIKVKIAGNQNQFINYKIIHKINLIIPLKPRDFENMRANIKYYKKFIIGINKLVIIGNKEVEQLIKRNNQSFFDLIEINFINEKELIDVDKIKKLVKEKFNDYVNRTGWYIQQFLKMQYSKVCKEEYYLIWDGDTVPVKEVTMFNNEGKPYFDIKYECHKPYFITMKKLFPELDRKNDYSFISEHMLIKTKIMKNMINKIDINDTIPGDLWYEKVINSINASHFIPSGFSEYETYGTFTNEYYKNFYEIRVWNSLRSGKSYRFNPNLLTSYDIKKLARKYDAITFEIWLS